MAETSLPKSEVIVGTPLCRRTAFMLDKFLSNQQEIQQAYPGCRLVLATDEPDFVAELGQQIDHYRLKGEVITYKTIKPDYARSRIWSITAGREALRQYALSQESEYLLFLDADMVYEPAVIGAMKSKIQGFDVASSGYRLRRWGELGFSGCALINRKVLNRITFRCYEFKNGQAIYEGESFDMDMFTCHARVQAGIFASIKHYRNREEYYAIDPQPLGWFRTLTNNPLVRYMLVRMSILIKYNIAYNLQAWLYKRQGPSRRGEK